MAHTSRKAKSKSGKRNAVSIRLVESAVYLRNDGSAPRRSRTTTDTEPQSAQLRGLLVLDLVKPTKITNIDVELVGLTSIGARRVEVAEEHRIYHATTTYFQASKHRSARRAISVGPGISYAPHADEFDETDHDWDDTLADRPEAQVSTTTFVDRRNDSRTRDESRRRPSPAPNPSSSAAFSSPSSTRLPSGSARPGLSNRRVSVDSTFFQRFQYSETYHPDNDHTLAEDANANDLSSIPPYSPFAAAAVPSPSSSSRQAISNNVSPRVSFDQSTLFEELPNSTYARSHLTFHSQPNFTPFNSNPSLNSLRNHHPTEHLHASSSGTGTGVILEQHELFTTSPIANETLPLTLGRTRAASGSRPPSVTHSRSQTQSPARQIPERDQTLSTSSSIPVNGPGPDPLWQAAPPTTSTSRKGSRFSLSAVSSALRDAVRSTSPHTSARSREASRNGRLPSVDTRMVGDRGRRLERGTVNGNGSGSGSGVVDVERRAVKGGVLSRLWGDAVEEYKEFKPGTYTYPIAFNIPGNAPPSMYCDFGSVTWKLKANVHRPGTFKAKMTAVREVITVSSPTEEDTEDTENIIVERQWDNQLQYLLSISGRSFCIGGTLPISITLMPLAKAKVHRISVFIEEKVDYYTHMRRVARSDPATRFSLLSIKGEGKGADPILPLESDDVEAFRNSPMFQVVNPDDDLSETASNFMGPGPWTFHSDLKLPSSCGTMKFTNRNKRSNILVNHVLKVVLRVERGDDLHVDLKTGKRKLFDIVVQTPVLILSCRCNPEWTALPRYSEAFDDMGGITPTCPCQSVLSRSTHHGGGFLDRITSRHSSSSSSASAAETHAISTGYGQPPRPSDLFSQSIVYSNLLYERLVSGQETESGELPPAYEPPSP